MREGVVRRAAETIRREGLGGAWFTLLARTLYRRMLLIEHRLDAPPVSLTATVPVSIERLAAADVDAYLRFRPDADRAEIARRLRDGQVCFVARHDGRIVSAAWGATGRASIEYLALELPLAPDEAYLYDSFTLPEHRGRNIPAVRGIHEADHFRQAGYERLLAAVLPESTPALRHARKAGWVPIGRMGYLGIGPWRRRFLRMRPGARPPGRPVAAGRRAAGPR
jgi:GNAT superfamily N-acetyltransferase